eukprot:1684026-Karenia_brevis.AAC.1
MPRSPFPDLEMVKVMYLETGIDQARQKASLVRQLTHPWLLLDDVEQLTHCRFGESLSVKTGDKRRRLKKEELID